MNSLTDAVGLSPPPLGVYVHLPWCLSKCPYCDFNSHAIKGELPADRYVDALLLDLEADLPLIWGRTVHSVFIGGGTPSLFPARQIERLLDGLRARLDMAPGAEVTLEANPGAAEHDRFVAYRDAGVNRISLGIHHSCTIHIRVENNSQVGLFPDHCRANGIHGFLILRIGHMVGKAPVRI